MGTHEALISGLISWSQNMVGIVFRPYETYRRIIRQGTVWELPFLAVLLAVYFATASLVKTAAFRPFLLTRQFILLGSATGLTYILTVTLFYQLAKKVGGQGTFGQVAMGWAYTLIPTLMWFLVTSLLYVIIPPPRTTSMAGITYSVLFLVFSTVLLFWKMMLGYLVLRFGMRLNLSKILIVLVIGLPILAFYSVAMYKLGIFRIPFI
jgi:hypothetical protein